jgi:hypothetical protein
MRIGRKRRSAAWLDRVLRALLLLRSASSAKSIIMIAFFSTIPIKQDDPDQRDDGEVRPQIISDSSAPTPPTEASRGS